MIEDIEASGLSDRIVVQSFSPTTVGSLRDVAPHIRRGLLVTELAEGTLRLCHDLQVSQANPSGQLVQRQPETLERFRAVGLASMVWTVNQPEHWAELMQVGPDGIITDRPDRLRGWLAGRS